jgi:putative Mg2+ transporter-C (MgtC) family protein
MTTGLPDTILTLEADLWLLLRVVIAALLSALLGWEREASGKPAGLRTHMLVGMSAALFVMLGELMLVRYRDEAGTALRLNMIDVLGAVVSGISFLGAGMIFVSRGSHVQGLTTAASILATAAVSIAVGLEHYVLAVGTTVLLLFVLRVGRWLERPIQKKANNLKDAEEIPGEETHQASEKLLRK